VGRAEDGDGVDSVSTDSAQGVVQVVEHLLATGRRRIAFLNGPLDTTPGVSRQAGFDRATAGEFGGVVAGVQIAEDFTMAAGFAAARTLLDRCAGKSGSGLDAVVAANDLLAIGAIRAAQERGLEVPGDLAVTGMDDTEIGRAFYPALTSVSLRSAERARAAARILLDRLDPDPDRHGPGAAPRHTAVGPQLVVRASTARTDRSTQTPTRKEDAP
jgi:LacI family transcriptional regulator